MVYKWNFYERSVPAQAAGEELERIKNVHGEITKRIVVDESEKEEAVLHPMFEWNNDKAADNYRLEQARQLIREIKVEVEVGNNKQIMIAQVEIDKENNISETCEQHDIIMTRAVVNVDNKYMPIHEVLNDDSLRNKMLNNALKELINFKNKYAVLKAFDTIMKNIDEVLSQYNIMIH